MRIGIFTDTYYPQVNGVVTSILMLEKELRNLGHDVYIFTTSNPKAKDLSENIFRLPSMPFIFLPTYRIAFFCSPKMLRKIKNFNLDIIHTQTEFSIGLFGKMVSKFLKIPMVHTYHTMYEDYVHYIANGYFFKPKAAQKLSKIFCNMAKNVIVPTQKTKDCLIAYGVKKPIEIIPTGIELEKFEDCVSPEKIINLKKDLGLKTSDFVILFLGRVAKEKSIDVLISQMPNIIKKVESAKLLIVGGGPYLEKLKDLSCDLCMSENIFFTGEISWQQINLYYKLADVFVTASTSETQGLTCIEAMASEVPVICKNDPSVQNLIEDKKNGFLFDDAKELSGIIYDLKQNRQLKEKITSNAKITVEGLSCNSFAKSVQDIYYQVIKNEYKKRMTNV